MRSLRQEHGGGVFVQRTGILTANDEWTLSLTRPEKYSELDFSDNGLPELHGETDGGHVGALGRRCVSIGCTG